MTKKPPSKKKSASDSKLTGTPEFALTVRDPHIPQAEALQVYIESLKRYPLLSPEKELEVAKKFFDEKDPAAARLLILSNLRLVVKIAYDYMRSGFHLLDLIQEGNIGLMRAVQDYDPYRGVKLSSYASHWIKAYIRSFVLSNWSMVKMGTTKAQRTLFYRLQKEKQKIESMGLRPEPKLLAERLNVKEKEVIEMSQRLGGKDVSLQAPLRGHDGSDSDSLLQLIPDGSESFEERLAQGEIQRVFHERLDVFERTLTGKELIVFRERMRSDEAKTLQEIGDKYQITRERVRQIEARVLEKLKDFLKSSPQIAENIIDLKPKPIN
jgi:RNA polymerase sigma-32 factor